jgi:hypothetical protein
MSDRRMSRTQKSRGSMGTKREKKIWMRLPNSRSDLRMQRCVVCVCVCVCVCVRACVRVCVRDIPCMDKSSAHPVELAVMAVNISTAVWLTPSGDTSPGTAPRMRWRK